MSAEPITRPSSVSIDGLRLTRGEYDALRSFLGSTRTALDPMRLARNHTYLPMDRDERHDLAAAISKLIAHVNDPAF